MSDNDKSKIDEAVERITSQLSNLSERDLEVIEEAISVSAGNPMTTKTNMPRHFDRMWRDVRAIFKLVDKGSVQSLKNSESLLTTKAALIAAGLEIRRQVKKNQRDLASIRKDLERETKAIKKQQKELIDEIKSFKKMVDLYLNPPAKMGPISRRTLKPYKGVERD